MTLRYEIGALECRYGMRTALRIEPLGLNAGELTAIVGPNGAGKSTLIKALAGLLQPVTGEIRQAGIQLHRFSDRERARRIAYLPADSRLAWPLTARRVVELGRLPFLKPLSKPSAQDQDRVDDAIERAGAAGLTDRRFDALSSGEKARILLARALATDAPTLLLDEPAAALDPRHQLAVTQLLKTEAERGVCVVITGHSLELVSRFADRVLVVDEGGIVADGAPDEALRPDILKRVFGLNAPGGVPRLDWSLA
ncbi:MAG: iron ABC transporter ATP-binding protein [Hyphobacterium sp.]|nr:MAG: iron ABC transporter ATP-binding protein [Hyphobacterium sp.]